jgi:hypothetical protein
VAVRVKELAVLGESGDVVSRGAAGGVESST